MNITQDKIDNLNTVLTVKINPDDYTDRVEKAIKAQAKKAKVPGFRAGMVPPSHIKRMYGKEILVNEINDLLNDTLTKYIAENKLEVLGQPLPKVETDKQFNWDFTDEFEFSYEMGLAPEFTLNFSSSDKLNQYVIKVDDQTLAERINNLRKSYGKMTNPEVSIDGDSLFVTLAQLAADGSVFEGGITNDASLRIDIIKDAAIKKSLIDLKRDSIATIDIQKAFDNDAAYIAQLLKISEEDARDLKSNFQLTVKNINRLEASDLDQAFFDKLFEQGTITTEEAFEAKIKEELESMMMQNAEQKLHADLYQLGLNKFDFNLPDTFLKRWLKASNDNVVDEELETGYSDFAKRLKWNLAENKILKENNIEIKQDDMLAAAKRWVDAQLRMYSPQAISEQQLEQYALQFLQKKENAQRIFDDVKMKLVFDYLKNVVTLTQTEIMYTDFIKLS